MLSEGKIYPHVRFPLSELNRASATATLHTGTYPETHGIERTTLWSQKEHTQLSAFHDSSVTGRYTRDTYSPKALLVNTIGDRIKEASSGAGLVYAIASDAETAIASGGWFANGAFWLDSKIASWASSSYYEAMPQSIEAYNRSSEGPNKRLVGGQMTWSPLRSYSAPSRTWTDWGRSFTHRYQGYQTTDFQRSGQ